MSRPSRILFTGLVFLACVACDDVVQRQEDTRSEDAQLDTGGDAVLEVPGSVRGFAFLGGASDHSGITVQLSGEHTAVTDATGAYAFAEVRPGFYAITASLAGFRSDASAPFRVEPGEEAVAPPLTLDIATGSLEGVARYEDGTTGGIGILVDGTSRSAFTDSEGRWSIDDVPLGNYTVRAVARGYDDAVASDQQVEAQTLTSVPELVLTTTPGTLVGNVQRELETDHSAIVITVNSTSHTGSTDASGNFTITGIPPGIYTVSASSEGFERFDFPPAVVEASAPTVLENAVLTRKKGLIQGSVEFVDLTTHGGALITLLNTPFSHYSRADGSYELSVPVGNYDGILASRDGFTSAEHVETITVTESGVATIPPLQLYGRANDITGIVTLESETEHGGIVVEAIGVPGTDTEGTFASTTSASDGSFTLTALPLGRYVLRYSHLQGWEIVTRDTRVLPGSPIIMPDVELRTCFVNINEDADFTNSTEVTLSLNCGDCFEMQVSNTPDFTDATWESCALERAWTLSGPDGENTVYARFKDNTQTVNNAISDTITLDSSVSITSFAHDATSPRRFNDVLHITLETDEPGDAVADIAGLEAGIVLYDDGTHGDAVAGDHRFELDYTIDSRNDINDATVTGRFTDAAGNTAAPVDASATLTVANPPLIFNIRVIPDNTNGTALITFETDEPTTAVLDWGGTPPAYANTERGSVLSTSHSFTLESLTPSTSYPFRLSATDQAGNTTVTSTDSFLLAPNPPSNVVALPGDGRFDLKWDAPAQRNIVGYHVYRSTTSGSDYVKLTTSGPHVSAGQHYPDTTAVNDTTYHYVVSSVDDLGFESAFSLEVSGTPTANTGGTDVSGAYSSDVVWTSSGSPYRLTSSVAIEDGAQLTIGPGVEVRFTEGSILRADGVLQMVGDTGAEIFVTSEAGQIGGQIFIRTIRNDMDLRTGVYRSGHLIYNTRIEGIGSSSVDPVGDLSALQLTNASVAVIQSAFANNASERRIVRLSRANILFVDTTLSGNSFNALDAGLARMAFFDSQLGPIRFSTFKLTNSHLTMTRTRVIDSGRDGLELDDDMRVILRDCVFEGCTEAAIDTRIDTVIELWNTDFLNNTRGLNSRIGSSGRLDMIGGTSSGGSTHITMSAIFPGQINIIGGLYEGTNTTSPFIELKGRVAWNHFQDALHTGTVVEVVSPESTLEGNSFFVEDAACAVETAFPDTASMDARGNYWGPTTTAEMETLGANADITAICDYRDDITVGRLNYDGWLSSAAPLVTVSSPLWRSTVTPGQNLQLTGSASDPEDGAITGTQLRWESDLDGPLGTGETLNLTANLREGEHRLWLIATDSDGNEGRTYTTLSVCPRDRADCDRDASNGCEVDLMTSRGNCSFCGSICPSRCEAGLCVP